MFNLEKEIEEWKQLLYAGEIDAETYNAAVRKLAKKDEKIRTRRRMDFSDLIINLFELGIIFAIVAAIIYFGKGGSTAKRNIEYVRSLRDLPDPIQIQTTGGTVKNVDGTDVEITYLAEYSISGRIVDVQGYGGYALGDKLSTRDFGISWGFLANPENNNKMKWNSVGNRFLMWSTDDVEWLRSVGGEKKLNDYFSNNHIISSDKDVEKLIRSVKAGEYVKLDGYLVETYARTDNGGYFTWGTSLSRKDRGDGACELLYVTNVTWLEEK